MREWRCRIADSEGLHVRPASELMMQARKFRSQIRGDFDKRSADIKDVLEIMGLGAKQGDVVCFSADGPDEEEAIEAIRRIME